MKLPRSLAYPGIGFFTSVTMLLAASAVNAEQSELVDRSKEAGLADAPGYGKASSMIDVNGDGWEDLWDSNTNQRPPSPRHPSLPRFYLNQKDGSFKPYDLAGVPPGRTSTTTATPICYWAAVGFSVTGASRSTKIVGRKKRSSSS